MLVKATYLLGKEDEPELLNIALENIQKDIEIDPHNISLYTDEDELIGVSIKAYIEDDHIVIEYDCDEKYISTVFAL